MTTTPDLLRHLADLLDGFPGIPEPLVIVQPPGGSITVSFHPCDADDRARAAAVDMLLAVLAGDRYGRGGHALFHGRDLYVNNHDVPAMTA